MFNNLRADLRRYLISPDLPRWRKLRTALEFPGFQATVVYRFGRWARGAVPGIWGLPIRLLLMAIYRLLNWLAVKMLGIRIALDADIGPGIYIGHFGGIEIDACAIGSHCSVNQQTKILFALDKPRTHIGDRVWVGSHVRIAAGTIVGAGAALASGAIVENHVKARSLVGGNPARVMALEYDNTSFSVVV